jgi:peroxisomal 2,4-dienoyl-CoA reductase
MSCQRTPDNSQKGHIRIWISIKATLPYVRKSRGAYIHVSATLHYLGRWHWIEHYTILMFSISAGIAYQSHVSAAKAGVDALSAVLAVEEGPHGVRSNVVAPGAIAHTEGWSRLSSDGIGKLNAYPLGREGVVGDIANATCSCLVMLLPTSLAKCVLWTGPPGSSYHRSFAIRKPHPVLVASQRRQSCKFQIYIKGMRQIIRKTCWTSSAYLF